MTLMFAALKFFSITPENSLHKLIARSVFACVHVVMFVLLFKTSDSIGRSNQLTESEKLESKKELRRLLDSRMITTVVILGIHWKLGILPPLFGSCIMGMCSTFENDLVYSLLKSFSPAR